MSRRRDKEMKLGERIFMLELSLRLLQGGYMPIFHTEAMNLIRQQIQKLKNQA